MYNEMFPVFFMSQSMVTVRASQSVESGKAVFLRREGRIADLALDLSFLAIVAVKVGLWGITAGTFAVIGDVTLLAPGNGLDFHFVLMFKVRDEELPVPIIGMDFYFGKIIRFKFLVFRGMRIIKSPLF